ncbi:MAG: FecR family protein, partial [Turicibacter sp.]|nr:FecR family protein [Turicibacter sp.]
MKKMLKRFFALSLAFLIMLSGSQTASAAVAFTNARTITVATIEGQNADMFRSTGQRATPRRNSRLTNGYQLATGTRTHIDLRMDRESLLRMDENSRLAVEINGQMLGLDVLNGNALVKVAGQASNQSLAARVGSVILAVRGTMFTLGHYDENTVYIVMLSGSGEVDGVMLESGQILTAWFDGDNPHVSGTIIRDWHDDDTHLIISQIYINELDFFTLDEILNNREYLLENSNFITEELLEEVAERAEEIRPE